MYKGLINCLNCGKNYKHKLIKGRSYYICSGYANYGKTFCTNFTISEEEINETIHRHIELVQNKRIDKSLTEYIKSVEVIGEGYKIHYKDNTVSLMNCPNEHGMISIKY